MNYINIESKAELRSYLKKFEDKGHHVIALDIEAESNLHAYGEKLCLTQIFDGVNSIIIDPFRIDNGTLKLLFESTNILKVMYDKKNSLMHMNPGAAGKQGFHKVRTMLRFGIDQGQLKDLEVIELGKRG